MPTLPFSRVGASPFLDAKPPPGPPKVTVCYRHLSLVVERGSGRDDEDSDNDDGRDATFLKWNRKPKPRARDFRILGGVTGCFQPGSMTLVLGRPGSGKSALMKLLAGRVPTNASVRGDITYNGMPREEVRKQLPQLVAYVDQQDTHLTTLTVKETLTFAFECSGGLASGGSTSTAGSSGNGHPVDRAMSALGLQRCQDTLVGDAETRGASGGERKRVTIGELSSFGAHAVACYDEMSNGLDSAATFDIVHSTRQEARARGTAVVMALLQPSPEVVALFDHVLLLHGGQVLYHGPRSRVEDYFAALGCRRPAERDLADFLCDLGADDRDARDDSGDDDMAYLMPTYDDEEEDDDDDSVRGIRRRSGRALAQLWRSSPLGEAMDAQARVGMQSRQWRLSGLLLSSDTLRLAHVPPFRQSFAASTWTLLKREGALLRHRKPLVAGRVLLSAGVGTLFGTLFMDVDLASPQVMLGLLFAALIFLGLSQTSLLPTFLASRAVFYKQRRANMFRTPSFVLATLASQVPLSVLESLVIGAIVYWMGGLFAATSWRAFASFQLLLVLTSLLFGAFFFMLSACSPTLHVAHPVSMLAFLFLIVFSGFVVSKGAIPSYLTWLYWADPIAWALRALAVSQYRSEQLDVCVYDGVDYCARFGGLTFGQYALQVFDVPSDERWLPAGMGFLAALYAGFALLACLALEFRRYDEHHGHPVDAAATTAAASVPAAAPPPLSQADARSASSAGDDTYASYYQQHTPALHALQEDDDDALPVALLEEGASSRRRQQNRRVSLLGVSRASQPRGSAFRNLSTAPAMTRNPLLYPPAQPAAPTPVAPVTLAFQELWYSVPLPKSSRSDGGGKSLDLLRGVTGYALPGTMTALMGSSGAGKTTLMDVVAKRKPGKVRGRVLLNGHAASDLAVRRCAAYCEQMDVHSEAATFREALTFSAFLRQGQQRPNARRLTRHQQRDAVLDTVDEVLMLLALDDIADQVIRGSSMEQMKRLTIGVELAAQPSVLFLDEPTSGLDARSAKLIMDGVRKVADSGRTVVCTIHQPSAEVFFLFDNLLLLQRGGKTVYFGELGHEGRAVIEYFESIPGVPRIPDGGYNPATWMLEVIGAGIRSSPTGQHEEEKDVAHHGQDAAADVDFARVYDASEVKRRMIDARLHAIGIFEPSNGGPPVSEDAESLERQPITAAATKRIAFRAKRAAGSARQLLLLLSRFLRMYKRTRDYTVTRFATSTLLALVLGAVYTGADYSTYRGVNGGLGLIFLSVAFVGTIAFASALPLAAADRAAFYRERAAQTYGAGSYLLASTLIEVPFAALIALVYTGIFFPLVGFLDGGGGGAWAAMATYWAVNTLHILFQTFLAQLLVFALPSIQAAALVGTLCDCVCFLLMGYNPPASRVPAGYKWLNPVVPHKYVFSVLVSAVFGRCSDAQLVQVMATATGEALDALADALPIGCRVLMDAPPAVGRVPVRAYVDAVFGADRDAIAQDVWRFVALFAAARAIAGLCMRFLCHRRK